MAKIRNRYNQVPHLTRDTDGKITNSQLDITNESQEVSPLLCRLRDRILNRLASLAIQQALLRPCLVNLISKDTDLDSLFMGTYLGRDGTD